MRRLGFNIMRRGLAGVALFIVMVCAVLLIGGVPAATPDHLTEIAGIYTGATLPATADTDLVIKLSDRAAFFRVNDDRVPEVATAALVNDLRPGDRLYLSVYKRSLPANVGTRGVVPVAAIRTDTTTYLSLPSEGAGPPRHIARRSSSRARFVRSAASSPIIVCCAMGDGRCCSSDEGAALSWQSAFTLP